jgi:hypothetical protein
MAFAVHILNEAHVEARGMFMTFLIGVSDSKFE